MPEIRLNPDETDNHRARLEAARKGVHLSWPDPDLKVSRVYRQLLEGEHEWAAPFLQNAYYDRGVALRNDHHKTTTIGDSGILLGSEHATVHRRTNPQTGEKRSLPAEIGTAGLAALLAKRTDSTHVTMLGLQTRDANHDEHHVFRTCVEELLQILPFNAFVSLHGIASGYVSSLDDERSIDILLGTGVSDRRPDREPPEPPTVKLGEIMLAAAERFGLRAGLNERILKIRGNGRKFFLEVDRDGRPKTRLINGPPHTTRGAVEAYSRQHHLGLAAVQVELASTLRLVTREDSRHAPTERLGAAMGFLTMKHALIEWLALREGKNAS